MLHPVIPSHQPKQAPISDDLIEQTHEDTPQEKDEREADMGDDEFGTGSAENGEGAGGRLVLERGQYQ